MLTPKFKVNQDDEFIYITISLKYVKFSDVEFFIEANNFRFHLKPYFLNLYFSDNLKDESERNNSKYDVDTGILECKIEKEIHGTNFKDLDLIGNLLDPNQNIDTSNICKKIEEINLNSTESKPNNLNNFDNFTEEELNQYIIQKYFNNENIEISDEIIIAKSEQFNYGFNNEFNDVFKARPEELTELCDLDPGMIAIPDRYFYKLGKENEDFIEERYFCDEMDDEEVQRLAEIKFAIKLKEEYTDKELQILTILNKTNLSLLDDLNFNFYLEVLDIIFSYLYDQRITEYEGNSESGWCINKLSSVLSCLVSYKGLFYTRSKIEPLDYLEDSIKNALISNYRRVLVYPLYRSFTLCEAVKKDLCLLLDKGIVAILKIMLDVRTIFEKSEPRYLFNKCYVDQFCKWIQKLSNRNTWKIISEKIKKIEITKDDVKLDLNDIENNYLQ
jgi:protein SHQ1